MYFLENCLHILWIKASDPGFMDHSSLFFFLQGMGSCGEKYVKVPLWCNILSRALCNIVEAPHHPIWECHDGLIAISRLTKCSLGQAQLILLFLGSSFKFIIKKVGEKLCETENNLKKTQFNFFLFHFHAIFFILLDRLKWVQELSEIQQINWAWLHFF